MLGFIDQRVFAPGYDRDVFNAIAVKITDRGGYTGNRGELGAKLFLHESVVDGGRGGSGGLLRGSGDDKQSDGKKKTTHRVTVVLRSRGG